MCHEAKACLITIIIGMASVLTNIDAISFAVLYFVVLHYYNQLDSNKKDL